VDEGRIKDWHRIANKLPGRNNKDCRKRWCNKVTGGLKKGPWEEDEDSRLKNGVREFGYQFVLHRQRGSGQLSEADSFSVGPSSPTESEPEVQIVGIQHLPMM